MRNPIISVLICTYHNSAKILEIPLKSLANQKCPKDFYEVIIADNHGGEIIKSLANKYETRLINIEGRPSQLCRQINEGAKVARGEYILIEDHDITVGPYFISNLIKQINQRSDVDAWYIPYKIIAKGKLLTKIRNFEEELYKNTVIAAPRLIKKSIFSMIQWDPEVSSGAPDWDFTIQMKLIGAKFGYLKDYFYHHEEEMSFWQFISKKTIYTKGGEVYKHKWYTKDREVYKHIILKQYDPFYRLFWIFIEQGKWRKLIFNIHLYLLFLAVKITMSVVYIYNLIWLYSKNLRLCCI